MTVRVSLVTVHWEPVAGATGYEISVNGAKVATAGVKARSSKLSVGEDTLISVVDLPARSLSQQVHFEQKIGV